MISMPVVRWLGHLVSLPVFVVIFALAHTGLGRAQPASKPTLLWMSTPIGLISAGETDEGVPWKRKIEIGVIAPQASPATETAIRSCLSRAFNETETASRIKSRILSAFQKWSSFTPVRPDASVSDNADAELVFAERSLDNKAQIFKESVDDVQAAFKGADLALKLKLASSAACNHLTSSSFLALIQRVCSVEGNCGISSAAVNTRETVTSDDAARFEMLIAWARTIQGATPQSLLAPNRPVVVGLSSVEASAAQALTSFVDQGATFAQPTPNEMARALEQMVLNGLKAKNSTVSIPSATLLILGTPREVGVRLAQRGWIARPEFGLNYAPPDPNATFAILSDDVARRRLINCVSLEGVRSENLARVKECSGYNLTTIDELRDCLGVSKPCRPKIAAITRATAAITGISTRLSDLKEASIYPRLRAGTTFSGLADAALANCNRESGNDASGSNTSLSTCLLTKVIGSAERSKLARCLIDARQSGTDRNALKSAELATAADCYAKDDAPTIARLGLLKSGLKCVELSGEQLTECLLEAQGSKTALDLKRCVATAGTYDAKVQCFVAAKLPGDSRIAQCAAGTRPKSACLLDLLPPAVKSALERGGKCINASSTTQIIACAQALGVTVDPAVVNAAGCVAKGAWQAAAVCIVAKQGGSGIIADIASCYADNGGAGGPSAVAACYAAKALGFNEDLQMLAQCATAAGGEPTSTATCAFGKLALRELGFCAHSKFGEGNCFGENNTIRKALGIGRGSEIARAIDVQLDIINGWVAFSQRPGDTVEATLRNASHELTIVRDNVFRTFDEANNTVRDRLSKTVGPGVFVKVDNHSAEIGPVHLSW